MKRSALRAAFVTTILAMLPLRSHAAGEIYWFSLLSDDVYAAMDFYSGLFGWQTETSPTGAFMALRNGTPFAAYNSIEKRMPNVQESMWLAAIAVADVDRSVATARSLGATIQQDVTDLPGWGRFALIQDPQGAPVVLVVPARPLGGTEGYSGWRWAELWTHDTAAAAEFYTQVIGYEIEEIAVGDGTYTAFTSGGKRSAGLVALEQREIAPRWAPYVGVSDLRAILVRVWSLHGQVLREPAEIDFEAAGTNRVALIADPSGGAMFLYQLEEQAIADPALVARSNNQNMRTAPSSFSSSSGAGPNINVSVSVSVGYGAGWGSLYPSLPYRRPYGPPF